MKYAAWVILSAACVAVAMGYAIVFSSVGGQAVAAPPLSLEGFLDEKLPEAPKNPEKIKADNQACYVCHDNYQEEEFALVHAKENVGCVKCHGKSYDHRDDENHLTPPDTMYPPEAIEKNCRECHEDHDVAARKVIARWRERCPEKTDPEKILCTDCHGRHRLKSRSVRWNKKTGEFIDRKEEPVKAVVEPAKAQ